MSSKWTGTPLKDKNKYKWSALENFNIYNQYYYFQGNSLQKQTNIKLLRTTLYLSIISSKMWFANFESTFLRCEIFFLCSLACLFFAFSASAEAPGLPDGFVWKYNLHKVVQIQWKPPLSRHPSSKAFIDWTNWETRQNSDTYEITVY